MSMKDLMRQAQEMQKKMAKFQDSLSEIIVNGSAGAGVVDVKMNGKGEVLEIKIDPEFVSEGQVDILEDLLVAALRDGKVKVENTVSEKMANVTGGIKIPGLV